MQTLTLVRKLIRTTASNNAPVHDDTKLNQTLALLLILMLMLVLTLMLMPTLMLMLILEQIHMQSFA